MAKHIQPAVFHDIMIDLRDRMDQKRAENLDDWKSADSSKTNRRSDPRCSQIYLSNSTLFAKQSISTHA